MTKIIGLEWKVLRVGAALQQTIFYYLRLPISAMLGRGDQNIWLGMKIPVGLVLLRIKLFLLSLAPHQYNARQR